VKLPQQPSKIQVHAMLQEEENHVQLTVTSECKKLDTTPYFFIIRLNSSETDFFMSTAVFPCHYHSSNAQYPFNHLSLMLLNHSN
jgi:hypothetical protein